MFHSAGAAIRGAFAFTCEVFTDKVMRNTVQYIQYSQQLRRRYGDISCMLYNKLHKSSQKSYKRACYIESSTNLKRSHIKINLLPVRKVQKSEYRPFLDDIHTKKKITQMFTFSRHTSFTPASHF